MSEATKSPKIHGVSLLLGARTSRLPERAPHAKIRLSIKINIVFESMSSAKVRDRSLRYALVQPKRRASGLLVACQLLHGFERIYVFHILVRSQPDNPGKRNAYPPLWRLDGWTRSKSYLQDYARLNYSDAAVCELLNSMTAKPLSHFQDFGVSQTGVSFADVE